MSILPLAYNFPQPPQAGVINKDTAPSVLQGVVSWDGRLVQSLSTMYQSIALRTQEMIFQGTSAQRPTAMGRQGFFFATDTNSLYYDSGTWNKVGGGGIGPAGPPGIPLEPDDPDIPLIIPGPRGPAGTVGATGATGSPGPPGPVVIVEAELPDDPMLIQGPAGPTGATGASGSTGSQGVQGPTGPPIYLEAEQPEDPVIMPGPPGVAGAAGSAGSTGSQGPTGPPIYFESDSPDDPAIGLYQNIVGRAASQVTGTSNVAAPNAAGSGTYTMMGLAGSITPVNSGNIIVIICGTIYAPAGTTAGIGIKYQSSYGTGIAPTSNAALTGTQIGPVQEYMNPDAITAADLFVPFALDVLITGLTVGTTYWLDLAATWVGTQGDLAFTHADITAFEL